MNANIVDRHFRAKGIGVSNEWLEQAVLYLIARGAQNATPATLSDNAFGLFLEADLVIFVFIFPHHRLIIIQREICCQNGLLPKDVGSMNKGILSGPVILQVDEILNVGDKSGPNNRALKFFLTDGITDVRVLASSIGHLHSR